MENYIAKLKKGFPEYSFEFDYQVNGFSRTFVSLNGIQLGRINFRFGKFDHIKHYKPREYEYSKADDIFLLAEHWMKSGSRPDLMPFVLQAKSNRLKKTEEIVKWRLEHPKTGSRGRIHTNWMGEFHKLIGEFIIK